MAHQLQLEKTKYRQWAKAGLGLGYLKDGLAPFCQEIATEQHRDFFEKIQRQKSLSLPVTCGACPLRTLKPDHKKVGNRVCPFGQINCNCWFPNGKIACRNKICGAIYDQIIMNHASTPPIVSWKNTDSQLWTSDPWSIAKCFINAPGYDQKTTALDTDCAGLLDLIMNNLFYRNHIACTLSGANVFTKVKEYRNKIYHSSSMELEESESNKYIDDMISILQDGKELVNNPFAQEAVKKLQALKTEDFIITSQCMEEMLRQIKEEMEKFRKSTENLATREEYEDLKAKLSDGNEKSNDEYTELKRKFTELELQMAKEKEGKLKTEKEHTELKKKFTELEIQMAKEKQGKLETEKEHTELKKKLTELETFMSKEKEGKAEAEKEHAEHKMKLTALEVLMAKEKEGKLETEKEHAEQKMKLTALEVLVTKEKEGKLETEKEHAELKMKLTALEVLMAKEKEGKLETEKEHAELKMKLTALEVLMAKEKEGKLETEKEHAEHKMKLAALEVLMTKEKEGKLETEKEHAELKMKLTALEVLMAKEKEGKLETEKEHAELKMKLTALEVLMAKEKEEKLAAEKEYRELKKIFDKLEALVSEQKEEIKQIKEEKTDKKHTDYEQAKSEWRNNLIQEYRDTVLKVPAMPVLSDEECQFSTIYVRPKIVSEVKNENRETKEKEIKSVSEIFTKNDVPLKSVYVVGDAGTGKSSFCNYLVNCWCMAHSEGQIIEDEFGGVKEMKKFEFLFLVSLRHNQGKDSIYEMLKNQYNIDILDTLLEKESAKMIILIDGLDEWSSEGKAYSQFQTMGLPKRDVYKKYTIVTTSRPWKIHTLRIRDKEIQQMLKLKGFSDKSETEMVERTVSSLNSARGESKDSDDCLEKLEEDSLSNLKQVPIMLQQLICLWFDGKIDKTSRCAVYTEMLELFFTWNDDKTEGTSLGHIEATQTEELPECFADKVMCDLNTHVIYDMSQLAYETLFNCPKDESLTFDNSIFRRLKISDKTREICLKLGILTNDKCPSVSVSTRPKSMFSFIHKSVQEFLAAVNIAINYKTKIDASNNPGNTETQRDCIQFVQEVFTKCSTVNEILEQSNVIIMLCGLELRLATDVSRYICDIVNEDPLVQRYRRTVDSDDYGFRGDIQNLIFDSMKECNASTVENRPTFHIGDLSIASLGVFYIDDDDDDDGSCDIVCSRIDQQQITPDSVHSIYVDYIQTRNVKFSKYLPKFKHLEKTIIKYDRVWGLSRRERVTMIDEVNKSVAETIRINTSTLKSLSLFGTSILYNDKLYSLCKIVVHLLPSMNNLVAIEMTRIQMSHDDNSRFCEFLKGTSHLEQIHINIECECRIQHDVDLSKHQQLQYLEFGGCLCLTFTDTVNLEVFKCLNIKSTNCMKIFDSIMKCEGLKELNLNLDRNDKSVSFHTSITDRLVSVLPFLHNLSKLDLRWFRLTDNIIQNPSEMKSLKVIDLWWVIMSLTTWKKFVDSLPSIPHTVNVGLSVCDITRDGEECNVYRLSYRLGGVVGEKGNEAKQYVKDQKQLFLVTIINSIGFRFSTKK